MPILEKFWRGSASERRRHYCNSYWQQIELARYLFTGNMLKYIKNKQTKCYQTHTWNQTAHETAITVGEKFDKSNKILWSSIRQDLQGGYKK